MTTFRKGDVCTIEVVVESVYRTGIRVHHVDSYTDIHVKPKDLTMVRPKFEVGDNVLWVTGADGIGSGYRGHVLSIYEDHLWVDLGAGNFATVWTGKATRLDPEPDPEPVAVAEDPAPIPDLEPRVPRFDGESGEVE